MLAHHPESGSGSQTKQYVSTMNTKTIHIAQRFIVTVHMLNDQECRFICLHIITSYSTDNKKHPGFSETVQRGRHRACSLPKFKKKKLEIQFKGLSTE